MDKFFNTLRKGIILGTLLVFTFVFTYIPQPFVKESVPEAEAFFGGIVFDPTNVVQNTATAIASTSLTVKEFVLDNIAYLIAKTIISSMVGSLINWINSGFKGSPAFVQDLKRNLLEVADREAGEFIRGLGGIGSFICSPFQLDIQIALSIEYQQAREEKPIESCTLSGIVNNIEDFYAGVSEGGLEDWITVTQNPEAYTPYGQLLTARSAMRVKLANKQGETLTEINWGQGFLSGKICEQVPGPSGPKEECKVSKPGQTIANSLNKALGAGQDQLIAADEINELIGSLIGALANKAITGAAGLLGLSQDEGGGSYIQQVQAESSTAAGNSAVSSNVSTSLFTESLQAQRDTIASANQYINSLNRYANNTRNTAERRSQASSIAQNAIKIRDKAISDQPLIAQILNEYQALDTEKARSNTTSGRKLEITQRQGQLYSDFVKLNAVTKTQLKEYEEIWKSGLL